MKMTYSTIEELMSSCCNSKLKRNVSSVLRERLVPWSFISASVDGDICRSEFSSPIEGIDREHHLSCKISPGNEHWHFSICDPGVIPAMPRTDY